MRYKLFKFFSFKSCLALLAIFLFVSCRKSTTGKAPGFFFKDSNVVALCNAISNNDETEIDSLLKKGVDVNSIGKDGMNPLLWALSFNDIKTFEMVLKKGGNPNIRMIKEDGASVMIFVSKMPKEDFLKLAIKYGGDPNFVDASYKTPLFHAISSEKNAINNVKILVNAGSNVNHQDYYMDTPAIKAATLNQYHIVYFLLKNGANFTAVNSANKGLPSYMRNSYKTMLKNGKLYDYLLKSIKHIENKSGTKIDLSLKSKSTKNSLPQSWGANRLIQCQEKEKNRQEKLNTIDGKIKPTIDAAKNLGD